MKGGKDSTGLLPLEVYPLTSETSDQTAALAVFLQTTFAGATIIMCIQKGTFLFSKNTEMLNSLD